MGENKFATCVSVLEIILRVFTSYTTHTAHVTAFVPTLPRCLLAFALLQPLLLRAVF